jgi:hypothetical protein
MRALRAALAVIAIVAFLRQRHPDQTAGGGGHGGRTRAARTGGGRGLMPHFVRNPRRCRRSQIKDDTMGKTVMGAVVSPDGFIADDNDGVRPLFDWYGNGDVTWSFPRSDDECRTTRASATSCGASTATWRQWSSAGDVSR